MDAVYSRTRSSSAVTRVRRGTDKGSPDLRRRRRSSLLFDCGGRGRRLCLVFFGWRHGRARGLVHVFLIELELEVVAIAAHGDQTLVVVVQLFHFSGIFAFGV